MMLKFPVVDSSRRNKPYSFNLVFTMPFREENKVFIKHYHFEKRYGGKMLLTEFPDHCVDNKWCSNAVSKK